MTLARSCFLLVLGAAPCSACADSASTSTPDDAFRLEDVVYVGATTDEALERLLDQSPADVPSWRLVVDSPEEGAALAASTPATFTFRAANEAQRARPHPVLSERKSALALLKFLWPIQTAHAHGVPFSGTGHLLVFSDAASKPELEVFTDQMTYTPEIDAWTVLASSRQPMTLTITSAVFEENRLVSDGGPFVGARFSFSLR